MPGGENYEGNETYEYNETENYEDDWENGNQFENGDRYKLKENAEYEAGEGENKYHYETDRRGRIVRCTGTLELNENSERNPYAQRIVGGENRHTGEVKSEGKDDGGHLIATRFGGSGEVDNLVAMDSHLNRGEYKRMENSWADKLEEKNENGESKYKIDVDIRCKYTEKNPETGKRDSERPSDIYVFSKVTDRETGEVVEKDIYRYKNRPEDNVKYRQLM